MYVTYTRIYGWSDYGGESSYQPGYRLENMMWMTLLVYDYIIPGENDNFDEDIAKTAFVLMGLTYCYTLSRIGFTTDEITDIMKKTKIIY